MAKVDDYARKSINGRRRLGARLRGSKVGQQVECELLDFCRRHERKDIEALDLQGWARGRIEGNPPHVRLGMIETIGLSLCGQTPER